MMSRTFGGVAALVMVLAACASEGGTVASGPSPSADQTADLTITVNDGHAVNTWHLTCAPAGGDHPDPARACSVLGTAGARSLPPVPRDMICTQVYGGPETARIVGIWAGQAIDARFSRVNGCEIARWRALTGLLP